MILEKGIINYSFFSEYYRWMLDNREALKNLNNNNWWKRQMTEEENRMRAHPNRSHRWIPNRLEEIKRELIAYQLDAQLGKAGWSRSRFSSTEQCMRCNIEISRLRQYQKDLISYIDDNKWILLQRGKSGYYNSLSDEQHAKLLQEAIKATNPNYTEEEIKKSVIRHPSNGSHYMVSDQFGFCPDCFNRYIDPMLGWDSRLDNYK